MLVYVKNCIFERMTDKTFPVTDSPIWRQLPLLPKVLVLELPLVANQAYS